ncbi:hypothetical protein BU16DRAFT_617366 [Lophium mytilinum]|uniref:Uncharacterized protein n=1 Tax=Lophium mytilinum TaxID=390894 RepID=A0A6A6QUG6_9PEZI|nr:hypothetical protein BU16DRAFT_617366 [Lophium mytilinum]
MWGIMANKSKFTIYGASPLPRFSLFKLPDTAVGSGIVQGSFSRCQATYLCMRNNLLRVGYNPHGIAEGQSGLDSRCHPYPTSGFRYLSLSTSMSLRYGFHRLLGKYFWSHVNWFFDSKATTVLGNAALSMVGCGINVETVLDMLFKSLKMDFLRPLEHHKKVLRLRYFNLGFAYQELGDMGEVTAPHWPMYGQLAKRW